MDSDFDQMKEQFERVKDNLFEFIRYFARNRRLIQQQVDLNVNTNDNKELVSEFHNAKILGMKGLLLMLREIDITGFPEYKIEKEEMENSLSDQITIAQTEMADTLRNFK